MVRVPYHSFIRITQGPRQLFTQLQPGAQQAHLGVGLAETQGFGRLLYGQSFHVPQEKNEPVFFVQPGQRLVQQPLDFVFLHQLFRGLPPVRDEFGVRNGINLVRSFGGFLQ